MPSRSVLAALGAAATLAGLAVSGSPALAATPAATTLGYTGAPQTVAVPAGANAVKIAVTGGSGANTDADGAAPGGRAATVSGYVRVGRDTRLTVDVGGAGHGGALHGHATAGGWGYTSGGGGGSAQESSAGGGGGGSSAVLLDGRPVAVAGGGGGTGGIGTSWVFGGGAGGDAGATARDGGSSGIPGAAGKGGSTAGGSGATAGDCHRPNGGGGGGGGGGAATPGGGGAGGCGAFSPPVIAFGGGGGGGAGSSLASDALAESAISTATTRGAGTVTLTWYAGCQDATELIDSTTANHTIDVSRLCPGADTTVQHQTGDGSFSIDPATDNATFTVEPGSTGVSNVTLQSRDVFGDLKSFTLTLLVAPANTFALSSGGMTLDARTGGEGDPALAETADGSHGQQWSLQDAGDGTFTLRNDAQDNCLATSNLGVTPGTPFELDTCGYDIANPLRIAADRTGDGITITDVSSGLPLTFSSLAPGARLVLGSRDDSTAWTLARR